MTLPELLIVVTVMGLIAVVMSATIIVTLRQQDSTEGRLNVARAEQQVGMWLPGDLSSAAAVSTDPARNPCDVRAEGAEFVPTSAGCPDLGLLPGSNALLIGWAEKDGEGNVTYTNVSYYFSPATDGNGFQLIRIECVGGGSAWSCSTLTVLSDLPGPPPGVTWEPGVTRPDWVILVSEPLAANAVDETDIVEPGQNFKNARRVVVTINGGGSSAGAGGGTNHISITAGGTFRNEIAGTSLQGAPSFNEARSLCGGPLTLIVDESNSVGNANAGGHVLTGVRDFVTALIGTPVKIQVVAFHTTSHTLGTDGWHRYYDMTNEADVNHLLGSIDDLRFSWPNDSQRRGGTNWEEAFFRTFFNEDASTADTMPDKVVFFTDGIPTFDRLVHSTGTVPLDPPDPGPAWPDSNGSEYSQVAFDRANYIATRHRSTTELIGVAVGAATTSYSPWITNPGAGYHTVWERGSYSHVRDTTAYYLRYQRKNSSSGPWYWVNRSTYDNTSSSRRRDLGWTEVDLATYLTVENPPNSNNNTGTSWGNSNDGARYAVNATPVSTAEYQANSSDPAYRAVSKQWSNSGPDWEPVSAPSNPSSPPTGYRSEVVWGPPYTEYSAPETTSVRNDRIIGRVIAGGDNYVEAVIEGGQYANVKTANLYSTTNWSLLPTALKAIALGDCGGSLTIQTRINGAPASDPFTYQNTQQFDASGNPLEIEQRTITTNRVQPARTFDLDITSGLYRDVVIVPQHLSDLAAYQPAGWTCRAGLAERSVELVDIPDSPWKGIKVRVGANEAVSCIQAVTR